MHVQSQRTNNICSNWRRTEREKWSIDTTPQNLGFILSIFYKKNLFLDFGECDVDVCFASPRGVVKKHY